MSALFQLGVKHGEDFLCRQICLSLQAKQNLSVQMQVFLLCMCVCWGGGRQCFLQNINRCYTGAKQGSVVKHIWEMPFYMNMVLNSGLVRNFSMLTCTVTLKRSKQSTFLKHALSFDLGGVQMNSFGKCQSQKQSPQQVLKSGESKMVPLFHLRLRCYYAT